MPDLDWRGVELAIEQEIKVQKVFKVKNVELIQVKELGFLYVSCQKGLLLTNSCTINLL